MIGQPDEFEDRPVQITPRELANKIHKAQVDPDSDHSGLHSCGCMHLALYYLGINKETGLYWPDGNGGNAHKV